MRKGVKGTTVGRETEGASIIRKKKMSGERKKGKKTRL